MFKKLSKIILLCVGLTLLLCQSPLHALTSNQEHVAEQLASITSPTPDETAFLNTLAALPQSERVRVLDQLSGQPFTNLFLVAEDAAHQFIRRLYDPLRSLIENPCCPECVWDKIDYTLWSQISGGRAFYEGDKNAKGYKSSGFELSLGGQATWINGLTVGTAASYEVTHQHYNIDSKGRNRTFLGGIYGLYRPLGWYCLGNLVGGHSCDLITRSVIAGDLHFHPQSKPIVSQATAYVEVGKDCGWRFLLLQPFIGLEYGYYQLGGFHEHKGEPFNLQISKRSRNSFFTRLGVHFTPLYDPCVFQFSIDLAWRYRCTSLGNNVRVNFQDFGNAFNVKGFSLHRNSIEATINYEKPIDNHWSFFVEVNGQAWLDAVSYSLAGGIFADW